MGSISAAQEIYELEHELLNVILNEYQSDCWFCKSIGSQNDIDPAGNTALRQLVQGITCNAISRSVEKLIDDIGNYKTSNKISCLESSSLQGTRWTRLTLLYSPAVWYFRTCICMYVNTLYSPACNKCYILPADSRHLPIKRWSYHLTSLVDFRIE